MLISRTGSNAAYATIDPEISASTTPLNGETVETKSQSPQHLKTPSSAGDQLLTWISPLLTVAFLILTAVYGSHTVVTSRVRFLYSSSSNTIFVLSVLSGLTGVFLTATIASAFEKVQWLLISRSDGLRLSKFFSLQAGTSVIGLLALTAGGGHPLLSTTRLWSATRLISIALIPVLGILIMSNVNTRMAFDVLQDSPPSLGWGVSLFNASLAKNVSSIADHLVQAELATFLSESTRSIDITPASLRAVPCSHRPGVENTQNCKRTYFVPGGVELAAPEEYNGSSFNKADVFLAKDQQGYILDFVEGPGVNEEWQFKGDTDCEVYGFPFGAVHLCLNNAGNNTLHARIVYCPSDISTLSMCWDNTTWHSNPGWTTSLTTTFRRATVAYSKSNGTILSHVFSSTPIPAPVNATEMLEGYRSAFSSFPDLHSLLTLLADPESTNLFALYVFPAMVWANLKGVDTLGQQNPAIITRAADTLQCLLAIMLYYCQPSLFARALSPYAENSTLGASSPDLQNFALELRSLASPNTEVVLAALRYQLVVGRATLVAYIVLCGFTLVLCLVTLCWTACAPGAANVPRTTAFPAWNERVRCKVEYKGDGAGAVPVEEVEEAVGGRLIREAEEMRIVLTDRST